MRQRRRFCISHSKYNVNELWCALPDWWLTSSLCGLQERLQAKMYNTFCWTSFFHNIKLIVLAKKRKALLLLQIDKTYNPGIAAMECVFLLYIDNFINGDEYVKVTKQKGREFSPLFNFITSEFLLSWDLFLASLLAVVQLINLCLSGIQMIKIFLLNTGRVI